MLCYAALGAYGFLCLAHADLNLGPFWVLSAILLMLASPISFVAAWRGMWQIERPLMYPIVAGILVNAIVSWYDLAVPGQGAAYLVIIAVTGQAFVARWVRIKTSYVSPAKIEEEYRKGLENGK